jgi:hypothetical protein
MNVVAYFRIWSAEIRNLHVVINCSAGDKSRMRKGPRSIMPIMRHTVLTSLILTEQNNMVNQ